MKYFLIFGAVILISAYFVSLHMIDLSYNAKGIEGIIDDNGFIQQTPEEMYRKAFLFLTLSPVLITVLIIGWFKYTN